MFLSRGQNISSILYPLPDKYVGETYQKKVKNLTLRKHSLFNFENIYVNRINLLLHQTKIYLKNKRKISNLLLKVSEK